MLAKGYLASNSMYASVAHTDEILDGYFEALAPVFAQLAGMSDDDIAAALPQGTAHAGFARLT